jgi:hypothetical protein
LTGTDAAIAASSLLNFSVIVDVRSVTSLRTISAYPWFENVLMIGTTYSKTLIIPDRAYQATGTLEWSTCLFPNSEAQSGSRDNAAFRA